MPESVQHIAEFLDYLRFEKRYSPHTILAYKNDLEAFFDFLEKTYGKVSLPEVKASLVKTWLASLKAADFGSRTINHKISTLRSFFKYQLKKGRITLNPLSTITALKVSKRLPMFVEEPGMDTLLRHVAFPDNWEGKTEKLIITILYNTGMRKSELINLQCQNIDYGQQTVKVLGKGNKERIIPISSTVLQDIREYEQSKLEMVEQNAAPAYLLINKSGKQLNPRWVYGVVKKYLSQVTTIEKRSPHILRHSFATHLMNNGADLNAVKELLGHSSLAATQVYTHNSIEKLKEIFKQAHPKAE